MTDAELEIKVVPFVEKYVCKDCKRDCKQIDLLCGCVRFYVNAFKDGYKYCEKDKGE